jgi:transposase InsO family protein
VFKDLCQRL